MTTVFVVFSRGAKIEHRGNLPDQFRCVRMTFAKAVAEAKDRKPAVIVEVVTTPDAEQEEVNRWELS